MKKGVNIMIPYVRRSKILELMHSKEVVFLEEISQHVGVSLATVRRDLKTLEEENQIVLLTGGAAKIKKNVIEKSLTEKMTINKEEKNLIGSYAAQLVEEDEFIFIGPGTTEHSMIKHLTGKNVTVVTNGAFHIQELLKYQIPTIMLGGDVKLGIGVIVGITAIKQIDTMNFDKCFIGASGISNNGDISTSSSDVAEINKVALENSRETYIVADSSKIGQQSRYTFAHVDDRMTMITTSNVSDKYRDDNRFIFADLG